MAFTGLNSIIGKTDSHNENLKLKTYYRSLDDLKPSVDNMYQIEMESIADLAANIERNGLVNPIQAIDYGNAKPLEIISGERRFRACKLLVEQGKRYSFNGIDITGRIPVNLRDPLEHSQKIWAIMSANAARDLSGNEKNELVDLAYQTVMHEIETGVRTKDEVGVVSKFIAQTTGISYHWCRERVAEIRKQDDVLNNNKEQSENSEPSSNESNTSPEKTVKKQFKKCSKKLDEMNVLFDELKTDDIIKYISAEDLNILIENLQKLNQKYICLKMCNLG